MAVSLLVSEYLHGRLQSIVTLVVALLLLMVSPFPAAPFGTLAYLTVYGFFKRGGASVILGLILTLKIAFVVCLVLAQRRMLQNKGLVLMILTSFLATVVVSILHGIVPGFLVSITDVVAAIVAAILAVQLTLGGLADFDYLYVEEQVAFLLAYVGLAYLVWFAWGPYAGAFFHRS